MHEITGSLFVCDKCGGKFVTKEEAVHCESLKAAKVSGIKEGMVVSHAGIDDMLYMVMSVFTSSKSSVGKMMRQHKEYATVITVRAFDTHVRNRDCDGITYTVMTSNLTKVNAGGGI